jgi:hypothetical protein
MKNKPAISTVRFHNHGDPVPIRFDSEQDQMIREFQAKTGLGKSFIIRRCVSYALSKFLNDQVDILTLKEKP